MLSATCWESYELQKHSACRVDVWENTDRLPMTGLQPSHQLCETFCSMAYQSLSHALWLLSSLVGLVLALFRLHRWLNVEASPAHAKCCLGWPRLRRHGIFEPHYSKASITCAEPRLLAKSFEYLLHNHRVRGLPFRELASLAMSSAARHIFNMDATATYPTRGMAQRCCLHPWQPMRLN